MAIRLIVLAVVLGSFALVASAQAPPVVRNTETRAVNAAVTLPNTHGQVWKEYDLSPYTSKITTTERPEQAVVDWILRETGTEVWFSEPLGLLSADRRKLKVYHTPEMQRLVQGVVDQFVASGGESHLLGLRMVTVGNPNWRGKAHTLLRPVNVQSPGVEAWLTSKENAAVLLGELKKRPDFREHNSPHMVIQNGQSQTVSRTKPRTYLRATLVRDPARPTSDVEQAQIDEGFSLQISPLLSTDGRTADAVIKCQIDQVEKLVPVFLEPAVGAAARQRTQIQIPQIVSWRLHERFRWPSDQVIVLSCGVVAAPAAEKATPLSPLVGIANRADALLFIECLGKANPALVGSASSTNATPENRGRY